MTQTNQERGRITARVPKDIQDTLEQAAELLGATLNQFVVQAALTEARRVIQRDRMIHLSSVDAAFLLNLLEKPPAPSARLRKAFQSYKKRTLDAEQSTVQSWFLSTWACMRSSSMPRTLTRQRSTGNTASGRCRLIL